MLQSDTASSSSLENAAHVTSFCSFADMYRPKFSILENIRSIKFDRSSRQQSPEADDDDEFDQSSTSPQNVLRRLVACLVSVGYQVNHFLMHSEDYGSCQRRERLILTIAVPGSPPIKKPNATHGTPAAQPTGTILADEEDHCSYTPFRKINCGDGTGDLPRVDMFKRASLFLTIVCPITPWTRLGADLPKYLWVTLRNRTRSASACANVVQYRQ